MHIEFLMWGINKESQSEAMKQQRMLISILVVSFIARKTFENFLEMIYGVASNSTLIYDQIIPLY